MRFPGSVPVPEIVLELWCEQCQPGIADEIPVGIHTHAQQFFADIGELGRIAVFARTNRHPALHRANDKVSHRICRAGGDVDPGFRRSNQPRYHLIVLEGRVRIEGARCAQIDAAGIRGKLQCSRPVQASVAGQYFETLTGGSWGQHDVVLSDQR